MAYIEAHQELRGHRKVRRMARELGIPRPQVIGHMLLLWMWALDGAPTGDLSKEDAEGIAEHAMWDGDPDVFLTSLQKEEWLVGMQLHDWEEYTGKILERRRQRAEGERARRAAAKGKEASGKGEESKLEKPRGGHVESTREPRGSLPERSGAERSGAERVCDTDNTHTASLSDSDPAPNPEPTEEDLRSSHHIAVLAVAARRTICKKGMPPKPDLRELRTWDKILRRQIDPPDVAVDDLVALMERIVKHPRHGPGGLHVVGTPAALERDEAEMWSKCPAPTPSSKDVEAEARAWRRLRGAELENEAIQRGTPRSIDDIREQVRREWSEQCKGAAG